MCWGRQVRGVIKPLPDKCWLSMRLNSFGQPAMQTRKPSRSPRLTKPRVGKTQNPCVLVIPWANLCSDPSLDIQNTLKAPFTRTECLLTIERLFTKILAIEQLRRERPKAEDQAAIEEWNGKLKGFVTEIWDGLRVWGPLYETYVFIRPLTRGS
jgi:hypothetical protein